MKFYSVIIFSSAFITQHGFIFECFCFVNFYSLLGWHACSFVSLQNFAPFSVIIWTWTGTPYHAGEYRSIENQSTVLPFWNWWRFQDVFQKIWGRVLSKISFISDKHNPFLLQNFTNICIIIHFYLCKLSVWLKC